MVRLEKVLKGYTFRLYPNEEQKILIEKSFGCYRYIYNYFLDKTNGKKYIKTFDYIKDLPLLSKEKEWLKEVDSCLLRCSIFNLEDAINKMIDILAPDGRIAIITFHSLEDRIVKNVFKERSTDCICDKTLPFCVCNHKADGVLVNRKPIEATKSELEMNSRSSCAKLRILQKI